jgi:hypothetical protein
MTVCELGNVKFVSAGLTGILGDLAEVGSLELDVDTYYQLTARFRPRLAYRQVVVG